MISRWSRAACLLAPLVTLWPAPALAFETIDTMVWPSGGPFPAYPGDDIRPWSVWTYAGVMHDSNVQRTATNEQADTITRFGVGGSYAARVIGRQSAVVDAYGEYRDYNKFDNLDHFAYGLRADWLWEIGNELSGTLGWRRTHRLAELGEALTPRKDLITEDRFAWTGAYRFAPDWRITAGLGTSHVTHDGRPVDPATSVGTRAGIEHVSGLGNTIGAEVVHTEGEAPVDESLGLGVSFPNNKYTQNEYAATLTYALASSVRVRGRLGHTERTYNDLSGSDFSGTTGRGAVEWMPGLKTILVFEAYRQPDAVIDAEALYVDRRGVAFGISWAPTIKLVFAARFTHERRIYTGDPSVEVLGLPLRDETLRVTRFSAGWEPARHFRIATSLDLGDRESNVLGRDYQYTAVALNVRYQF